MPQPELDEKEKEKALEHTSAHARVIHEVIREEGEQELARPAAALLWSGLAAGLSMGFSILAEAALQSRLPDTPWRELIAKLGYPLGFLIVIIGKQQLFTENTLTVVLPLMTRRDLSTLLGLLRLWSLVLVANIAGAHLMAWVVQSLPVVTDEVRREVLSIGERALAGGPGTIFARGIFAGWLIATVVWVRAAAVGTGVKMIFLLTYLVAIGSFAHVIVGSIEVLSLVFAWKRTWWEFCSGFFLPALAGNIVGGVALVAALNHAQVVAGEE